MLISNDFWEQNVLISVVVREYLQWQKTDWGGEIIKTRVHS